LAISVMTTEQVFQSHRFAASTSWSWVIFRPESDPTCGALIGLGVVEFSEGVTIFKSVIFLIYWGFLMIFFRVKTSLRWRYAPRFRRAEALG